MSSGPELASGTVTFIHTHRGLGGGGNDTINYGVGTDVAIAAPGIDTFNANCETQIQ